MKYRLRTLTLAGGVTLLFAATLLMACAGGQQNEQPAAVDMTQCQNIADRAERSNCMDAAARVRRQPLVN